MAETTTTKKPEAPRTGPVLAPFTVEFGDSHNRTILLACFNEKFRGSFSNGKAHSRTSGAPNIGDMNQMPDLPGQRMEVDWRKRTVTVTDPLEDDEELVDRMNRVLRNNRITGSNQKCVFVPSVVKTKLNDNQLKTLVLELAKLRDGGSLEVTTGSLPATDKLDNLPGRQFFDPMNSSSRKPTFVDQYEDWATQVDRMNL